VLVQIALADPDTARRSRVFSASRSIRRPTWSFFSPPNSWRHQSIGSPRPRSDLARAIVR
jgi:hypothetical protein